MKSSVFVLFVLAALLAACGDAGQQSASAAPDAPAADAHGPICEEHGVPESMCTKCNPSLIAKFKAKGDWCEEHGFPESVCPICHPELAHKHGEQAPAPSDGPADGTKVRLKTKDAARRAGLQYAKVVAATAAREVPATARVVYDATRVAQVNPRMTGVVRTISADVGARVRAGSPLAVIESADVGAEQSRLEAARTRVEVAEANFARIESLRGDGISSQRELLSAQREREDARADTRAAQASLGMVGASADGSARVTLRAPIAGVVTQRNATIGRLVDGADTMFEIVDSSAMWLELDVAEADLALVAAGQRVTVTLDALPGRELEAVLSYVAPAIDPRTRTAIARAPLLNPDGTLRANLFGRGRIAVSDPRAALLVPRSALQRAREVDVVFVRIADDQFEARRVSAEPPDGDRVNVSGRLQAGDEVVTEGSFLLKTETLKDSIGAGCCAAD